MKKMPIFYTIFLALVVCQTQAMEQPFSSSNTLSASASGEFNEKDSFKAKETKILTPSRIESEADFSRLSASSLPKRLAAEALAIPAAAQAPAKTLTNKRKNQACVTYQCQAPGCNYKDVLHSLREHILDTHVDAGFICPQTNCSQRYRSREYFLNHLRKIHADKPELLLSPQAAVTRLDILIAPYMPQLSFKCTECSDAFKETSALLLHYSCAHPDKDKPKKKSTLQLYQCQACEYKEPLNSLQKHILAKHVQYRYKCPQLGCSKEFTNRGYLKKHLQEKHPGAPSLLIPELAKEEINRLIKPYMPKMDYQCTQCASSFETQRGLSNHFSHLHKTLNILETETSVTPTHESIEEAFNIPLEPNPLDLQVSSADVCELYLD